MSARYNELFKRQAVEKALSSAAHPYSTDLR